MGCYAYLGDVAIDLRSRIAMSLKPNSTLGVPTGVAIELPAVFEAPMRPRSGLALKYGISIVNTQDTIDTYYGGKIVCIMINFGHEPFQIVIGDRIAQFAIREVPIVEILEVNVIITPIINGKGDLKWLKILFLFELLLF